jgi:hypothetical protein
MLFEDLTSTEKEEFISIVKTQLVDELLGTQHTTGTSQDLSINNFLTLRESRLQQFPSAAESKIEGERYWYHILKWSSSTLLHSALRRIYVRYYSWGVLSTVVLEIIQEYSPILEVGAGNGYWAYEMLRHGIDVVATDNHSELVDEFEPFRNWMKVEDLDAVGAIQQYRGRALLMCWPHGYALDAVEEYGNLEDSHTIIVIGEKCNFDRDMNGEGPGCVTDDPFGGVNKDKDSQLMHEVAILTYQTEGDGRYVC